MSTKDNNKEHFTRESVHIDFASIPEMIIRDLNQNTQTLYKNFKKEDVARFIQNPIRYSKDLMGMSNFLYNASPHYRRLINYYAKMSTLDHYVEPYGIDFSKSINQKTFRNSYTKAVDLVELMNIKHEFQKALITAWKLGTFYGFELFTKDSYFIKELPFDFCQISGIMDGVYTFSFDLSYFDRNPTQLDLYPKEFKSMFNSYKSGSKPKWQEIDPNKSICIKINEEFYNDMPPFTGIFGDIFDIEDYKALRKINAVLENYKFIVEKIPLREDSDKNNDFLIDLKTVSMFHNKTANMLPQEIGIFSTPFEIETIEFKKDKTDRDSVLEAENSFYTSSGTSSLVFNGNKSNQANLTKSLQVDESEVFSVMRQLERIITLKIKNNVSGAFKFRLKILDNTIFNRKDNTDSLLKMAQFGVPVKTMLSASLGYSPSAILSMAFLENDVLNLNEQFIPLKSAHTQNNDEGGRPKKKEDELTQKGEEQIARGDNDNRE